MIVGVIFSGICMSRTGLLFPYIDLVYLIFRLSCCLYMCMFLHKAGDSSNYCGADAMDEACEGLVLCSETMSKSAVTILSHGSASKGIHPIALFIPQNSPSGKAVGDCHTSSEIHCSEKKEENLRCWRSCLSCPHHILST